MPRVLLPSHSAHPSAAETAPRFPPVPVLRSLGGASWTRQTSTKFDETPDVVHGAIRDFHPLRTSQSVCSGSPRPGNGLSSIPRPRRWQAGLRPKQCSQTVHQATCRSHLEDTGPCFTIAELPRQRLGGWPAQRSRRCPAGPKLPQLRLRHCNKPQ